MQFAGSDDLLIDVCPKVYIGGTVIRCKDTILRWVQMQKRQTVASMLIPYVAKGIVGRLPDGKYTLLDKRPVGYLAAHE